MKYLRMRKIQIGVFIAAILVFAIIAWAGKIHTTEISKWQYARIQFDPFTDWIWNEPGKTLRAEKLDEIFTELSIPVPRSSSPNIYLLSQWAGEHGWELVNFTNTRGRFIAWFKRPYP